MARYHPVRLAGMILFGLAGIGFGGGFLLTAAMSTAMPCEGCRHDSTDPVTIALGIAALVCATISGVLSTTVRVRPSSTGGQDRRLF